MEISFDDIHRILNETVGIDESGSAPFPQANSFDRIINLCELLNEKTLTAEDITSLYDFDKRQTAYYTAAGRYLGLIEKDLADHSYFLTQIGKNLFQLDLKRRQLKLIELIVSHSVFKATLQVYFVQFTPPSNDEIVKQMHKAGLHNVRSESTFKRRASTIAGWIDWILALPEKTAVD
jgi:hypothetical protein